MREILNKLYKLSKKNQIKKSFPWFFIFLTLFLIINISYSQKISSLFFGLANNDKIQTVRFLQKIRNTKNFNQQLKYYENIFGPSLKTEVFNKEIQREAKIKELEQILDKNPQSRDVLYSLYLLYLEKEEKTTAEKYLRSANQIDPDVK